MEALKIGMLERTGNLTRRLALLSKRLVSRPSVPARATVEGLLEEARQLFSALKAAEAEHIDLAIGRSNFPFEIAQGELSTCFRGLGVAAGELREAFSAVLSDDERAELEDLALIGKCAPLTTLSDVDKIRAARIARAKIQGSLL